ncbi:2-oxoacid:ferredoxin oxidoreductase, alpha subunit [Schinkia azotoformans MEV2011]|uniref:2-oxoacid:ferredoxin oxidoreductase, alpha subunit n=1 Tax=Schinkia azotoformans MEV2011 TaxID=1348973 RepID=A0A072NIM9_SCHAZ|nr:thiamine pyrophosphate-dependent enzyme [Schinkia azotoformans]KEF37366.1 2-oxoacid:ferredoxin oxidoreductase, alpha subunit [Schinkia azotoformans MEV2011]MEC1694589.1 thiamine pyrophosphate-dependent enzyme [Schinkia azotoformans]MEC1718351.1 thiamine pyrophosphate-dependent enzyme [Schinkia azotoformans]MEC1725650.1 thiamine pyrophosphate-dependent enzyme [Schinkia azotoformans]MEC1742564.1 thiamine pyrophosphate-dependent enzyme [Schinkia azotoformans]
MAMIEKELQNANNNKAEQITTFESGNEMAAMAAAQINYHLMGYFPITPSTEVAQFLDQMKARGEHDIKLIAADGEHGSAGICYGAAVAGARVFNATSANGFMYMLEQLPVQSGTRFPMVMNLVTRAISGPLDIRGDHSDLYFGLNIGWVILTAPTPQAVYDMNIMALKIAEHSDVRLPVIVAYDGFFTSHQKRKVDYFADRKVVQQFVGERPTEYPVVVDPRNPVTIGAHMDGHDLMNNNYQQSEALYRAYDVYKQVAEEYAALSGRKYEVLNTYKMEDAEVALFLINSAAETAKDAVDRLRAKGIKAGVVSPNIIRPFPAEELRKALKNVKALLVGERADSYGGNGANMTHEIKSALQDDKENKTIVLSRVYGIGGKDFFTDEAIQMYELAIDAMEKGYAEKPFDYFGVNPGKPENKMKPAIKPMHGDDFKTGLIEVTPDPETNKLKVKIPPLRQLTTKPKRLGSGHGACPGCGIFPGLELFFKGIEGDVITLFQTGCGYVTTTGYPYTSHKQPMMHNLFQNGPATLSGTVEAFYEMRRRGEIEFDDDVTFVMITGDGGMDIGMGSAIGTANRNHKLIILEYDNEGYMNTGSQMSYSTPFGHMTSTTNVGKTQQGKAFHHKDTAQIMAATNIPYIFTGTEAFPQDLVKKAAKAQWYAQNEGMAYGKILITCPLNWKSEDRYGGTIMEAAVNCNFFPLYEMERGETTITYNPEDKGKTVELSEWLKYMGKTKHLLKPENADMYKEFEREIDRRWNRLKARHENPYL